MLLIARRLLPVTCAGVCALWVALGPAGADAQCRGGRQGMMRGGSPGMMGPMYGRSGMGGMGQGSGMTGGMGQGMGSMGQPQGMMGAAAQPKTMTGGMRTDLSDPEVVLSRKDELALTQDQVQLLEKMRTAGRKQASYLLNKEQKEKLQKPAGNANAPRGPHGPMMQGGQGKSP
jgi:hypothetical protein